MTSRHGRIVGVGSVLCPLILGFVAPSPVAGSVINYSEYVQNQADTIVQYDFVGTTESERLGDKTVGGSGNYLETKTVSSGPSVTYDAAGFDSTSTGVITTRSGSTGQGFVTSQTITMPDSVTFEAILQPGEVAGTSTGYMAGVYSGGTRDYFVVQSGSASTLRTIAGDNYNNSAGILSLTDDHWYYVAVTMSYDGSGYTTVDTWYADLSGDQTLVHASTNVVLSGTFQTNKKLGIGLLNNNDTTVQESWPGTIDEVTLYSGLKDEAFFAHSLDLILAPEPSTMAMTVFGLLGAVLLIRRRNRA